MVHVGGIRAPLDGFQTPKISILLFILAIISSIGQAIELDINNAQSVRNTASAIVQSTLTSYPPANGIFPQLESYYWWEAGAFWGAMIDYSSYTGDTSYNQMTLEALAAQTGENFDYRPAAQVASEANDDQAFWIFAVLDALEQGFPALPGGEAGGQNSYLAMADKAFQEMVDRYNIDSDSCGGGLRWQYNPANNGYDYKNAVSNGGFFDMAARLARYTGEQEYADWANKIWDWEAQIGLIGPESHVYDGVHIGDNCQSVDKVQWTYNNAIHMHGAAMMYDFTGGSSTWQERIQGLLDAGSETFFGPFDNTTDVMYEVRCELSLQCNEDHTSFKAYLARFWAKTSVLAPFTADQIRPLLEASASGAAESCSGPNNACGMSWWYGGYDGTLGLGQQLSALETIQALLIGQAPAPQRMDGSGSSAVSSPRPGPESNSEDPSTPAPSAAAPSSEDQRSSTSPTSRSPSQRAPVSTPSSTMGQPSAVTASLGSGSRSSAGRTATARPMSAASSQGAQRVGPASSTGTPELPTSTSPALPTDMESSARRQRNILGMKI